MLLAGFLRAGEFPRKFLVLSKVSDNLMSLGALDFELIADGAVVENSLC
jgi:Cu/Ag efflux pump CusA